MCAKSLAHLRILSEIAANGPLTFARFMDLALYEPDAGYYASGRAEIGKSGDFFTTVSVGPVFGKILAGQFREMWIQLGRPGWFALVEQGANDGQLALDILSSMENDASRASSMPYCKRAMPAASRASPRAAKGKVRWFDALDDLPVFDGIHFSNELVDAFPFHLVQSMATNGWSCVGAEQDRLVFEPVLRQGL